MANQRKGFDKEDLDFDEVRDSMEDFLGREVRKARSGPAADWSKADCSLGNAVTDHMAARVRDTLRYFSDRALVEAGEEESYADTLALTVRQSIERIVR